MIPSTRFLQLIIKKYKPSSKYKIVCIIVFSFFIASCGKIIMGVYGIHQPRIVNSKVLIKAQEKHRLSSSNSFAIQSKDYIELVELIELSYPEIMVFNKYGEFIPYKEDNTCNANAFVFIDSLSQKNSYKISNQINLKQIENMLVDFEGNKPEFDSIFDFKVFIFWTEWTGKLNKNHTKIWEDKAASNQNSSIKLCKVNCDFQSFWKEEDRIKIIQHFESKSSN